MLTGLLTDLRKDFAIFIWAFVSWPLQQQQHESSTRSGTNINVGASWPQSYLRWHQEPHIWPSVVGKVCSSGCNGMMREAA